MAEKIKSWNDLKAFREQSGKRAASGDTVIAVGMATCGVAAGAAKIFDIIKEELQSAGVNGVSVESTGCTGFCYAEPMVEVRAPGAPGIKYGPVDEDTARAIVREHIVKGELLDKFIVGQEVQRP